MTAAEPTEPEGPQRSRWERFTAAAAARVLDLLERIPEQRAMALGAGFGRAWARLGGPRTQVGRVNLRIAFPSWSEAEREAVLVRAMENIGRSFVEFARLARIGPEGLRERVRFEGLEHYEAAKKLTARGRRDRADRPLRLVGDAGGRRRRARHARGAGAPCRGTTRCSTS